MKWLLAQYIQLEIYFGHEWTAKNKDLKMLRSNGKMHIAVNTEHVDNEVIWCFWCSHWKYSTKKKKLVMQWQITQGQRAVIVVRINAS